MRATGAAPAACLVVSWLTLSAAGQEPARQVFRSGIDLVTVDAIVLDRDGRPVTDLTAADFIVTANRQQRKVRSAEFVAISTARSAPAAERAAATAIELIPSVTSNVGQPESRSFVIVVDVEQIRVGDGQLAMRGLSDFVSSLAPDDLAGVVALPYGRPRVDLTTDRAAVRQAIGIIIGGSQKRDDVMSVGEAASIEAGDRSVLSDWGARGACSVPYPDCTMPPRSLADKIMHDERRLSSNLYDTLGAIATAMKPLKGLKTIVLVSEGMVQSREVNDHLRRFAEAAAASRVMLYSLALDVPQTQAADSNIKPPDRRLDANVKQEGLGAAAHAAGGEMFLISGTLDNALKRIDTELSGYYLLSFESDPGDVSDKRKSIDIKVRRPNVSVRARTDYSVPGAATTAKPAPPPDLRATMGDLLRFPVPISDVAMDVATFASPAAPDATRRRVIIAAELPAGLKPAAAGFEIADDAGKIVSDAFEPNPAMIAGPNGPTYLAAVPLAPGHYQLKLGMVADDGRRGSIQHTIWVKASPPGPLRLGDIVVGSEGADGFTPVARVPEKAEKLAVRVELLANDASAFAGASVLLDIVRKGEPAPLTSATMPFESTANPLKRNAVANLTLARIPAGEYILRCTLQGATSSERVTRLIRKR